MPKTKGIGNLHACLTSHQPFFSSNLRAEAEPLRPISTSSCAETHTFVASAVGAMLFGAPDGCSAKLDSRERLPG